MVWLADSMHSANLHDLNIGFELQGPRCSIRSRAMYSDCTPDYIKMTALNIPAAVVVSYAMSSH